MISNHVALYISCVSSVFESIKGKRHEGLKSTKFCDIIIAAILKKKSKSPADGPSLQTVIPVIAKDTTNIPYIVRYVIRGKLSW